MDDPMLESILSGIKAPEEGKKPEGQGSEAGKGRQEEAGGENRKSAYGYHDDFRKMYGDQKK